jgi:hypothetical protein
MEFLILLVECLRIICSLIEIYYYRLAHKNKALLESRKDEKQHLINSEKFKSEKSD